MANFSQTTIEGDFEGMLELIENIRPSYALIANDLEILTKNFQFRELLELMGINV
ncbi:MAG: hypothetical protein RIM23_11285 [Coleofasciculus sp. G3-WIS-01]|uniref:hypothetical protein n=1 Tax=Coleofasciculus sp. G3-WIS-01 TaxID=3069528 RepID=UPI0032F6B9F5